MSASPTPSGSRAQLPWVALACVLLAQTLFVVRCAPGRDGDGAPGALGPQGPLRVLERRVTELEGHHAQRAVPGAVLEPGLDDAAASAADDATVSPPGPIEQRLTAVEARLAELEGARAGDARDALEEAERARDLARSINAAIARGELLELQRLLAAGLDVDARDEERDTPLAVAAGAGNLEAIDLLVAHGADLERTSGRRAMTPLLAALDADQEEAALELLRRGSSPWAVDKNGEGALSWASFNGAERVVRELLLQETQVDFRDHGGNTALMGAARRGHSGVVRMLLESGADPNARARDGANALSLALEAGHAESAALLREYGAR